MFSKKISFALVLITLALTISSQGYGKVRKIAAGFWLAEDGGSVAEVQKQGNAITLSFYEEGALTDEYIYIRSGAGKYTLAESNIDTLTNNNLSAESLRDSSLKDSIKVTSNGGMLAIASTSDLFEPQFLSKAPQLSKEDYVGTWYSHGLEDDYEDSIIITQRENSYDYDAIFIDHALKTYEKSLDLNIQTTFSNGFIFTDSFDNGSYIYFIESYDGEDTFGIIDTSGFRWTQTRMAIPEHIAIPQGYLKTDS